MKILVCCGSGLGSSFIMEMSIKEALRAMGIEAEVDHSDLSSASGIKADIYVGTRDLTPQFRVNGEIVSLNSMIDTEELKTKIIEAVNKINNRK